MRIIHPCKKCIVKPMCREICYMRDDNIKTIEKLFDVPSIVAMVVVVASLLGFLM